MGRKYTKVEHLTEIIRERKGRGETNREIGESFGLSKTQIKQLISQQNRKERLLAAGYIPRPKGRPRKEAVSEEVKRNNEVVQLRMTVAIPLISIAFMVFSFLCEAGCLFAFACLTQWPYYAITSVL